MIRNGKESLDRKKLLAINFGGIGDEILFLPTLQTIRNHFPDWRITLLLEPRSRSVAELTDVVDEVITFDIKKRPLTLGDLVDLLSLIKSGGYDSVVSSGSSPLVSALLFLSGIRERIGYRSNPLSTLLLTQPVDLNRKQYAAAMYHDLALGLLRQQNVAPPAVSAGNSVGPVAAQKLQHDASVVKTPAQTQDSDASLVRTSAQTQDSDASLVRTSAQTQDSDASLNLGAEQQTFSADSSKSAGAAQLSKAEIIPQVSFNSKSLDAMERFLEQAGLKQLSPNGRLILFHPGTSRLATEKGIFKTWPADSWVDLLFLIARENERKKPEDRDLVLLAGGPDDKDIVAEIQARAGDQAPHMISAYGVTKSLSDLAALISLCDLMVCVDSAPMHVAVGLRKPLVALFGPFDPNLLLPSDARFRFLWDSRGGTRTMLDRLGVNIPPQDVFNAIQEQLSTETLKSLSTKGSK